MKKPNQYEITLDGICNYLLERHQLPASAIVDDPYFDIQDRSRRNKNFAIIPSTHAPLMLKQARERTHRGSPLFIEAQTLRVMKTHPAFTKVRWALPSYGYFDQNNGILVTDLVHPATTASKLFLNGGSVDFDDGAIQSIAYAMADIHKSLARAHKSNCMPFLRPRDKAFGWADGALSNWDDVNDAKRAVVQRIEAEGLLSKKQEVTKLLSQRATPIHNDPRWDNFLVTESSGHRRGLNLRMIDWETCAIADPAYDVAFFLTEFLRFYLSGIKNPSQEPDTHQTLFPLDAIQHPANHFTTGYLKRRRMTEGAAARFQDRIRQYLPYCLIGMAFEMTQQARHESALANQAIEFASQFLNDPRRPKDVLGIEVST